MSFSKEFKSEKKTKYPNFTMTENFEDLHNTGKTLTQTTNTQKQQDITKVRR